MCECYNIKTTTRTLPRQGTEPPLWRFWALKLLILGSRAGTSRRMSGAGKDWGPEFALWVY